MEQLETSIVEVFSEDPVWDTVDRPWQVNHAAKQRLHVASYKVLDDYARIGLAEILKLHPGCVLVSTLFLGGNFNDL